MKRLLLLAATALLTLTAPSGAGEIGFVEDFALAKDRAKALEQLIPGTRDYYYYHCLYQQDLGDLDKVDEILAKWIARYNRSGRVEEIESRQALLRYGQRAAQSLEYLRDKLGVHFNHRRVVPGQKPRLATKLDPNRISRQTLTAHALATHPKTLGGFSDTAIDWLVKMQWDGDRRRHLLSRLTRPDYPGLVKLVVDDLDYRYSRHFGSMNVHRALLLPQLDECLKLKGDLLNDSNFVTTYLTKLRPGEDTNWTNEPQVRQAYFDRLWAFVSRLAPVHNSLKACVLYHRLLHDRAMGAYDKQRFLEYLKLPRYTTYVNRDWVDQEELRKVRVNLGADYRQFMFLPPVGNDEPLVRSYLMHFFVTDQSTKPYEPYVHDIYLKHVCAET